MQRDMWLIYRKMPRRCGKPAVRTKALVDNLPPSVKRFVYVSSSGTIAVSENPDALQRVNSCPRKRPHCIEPSEQYVFNCLNAILPDHHQPSSLAEGTDPRRTTESIRLFLDDRKLRIWWRISGRCADVAETVVAFLEKSGSVIF